MNAWRFILSSLRHYRRIHATVVLGVAVATAVLTGALLVGDSVRGSLRQLTLERLGYIDTALVAGHMFRAALADELAANAEFKKHFTSAEPAIMMTGTLQANDGTNSRRATAISIIGGRRSFGDLRYGTSRRWATVAAAPPSVPYLEADEIALTEPVARELEIEAGDQVLLRLPVEGAMPADSPLGEKTDTSIGRQFTVRYILASNGQARFALAPSQHEPRNAFVPLTTLQNMLDKPDCANAILVATNQAEHASGEVAETFLGKALRPRPDDLGLRIDEVTAPTACVQISADQLVLPDAVVSAAGKLRDVLPQPVVTYLANTIAVGEGAAEKKIPYSTISGVDSTAELGPLLDEAGKPVLLSVDEIALNDWAANDLQAKVGDLISVTFYEPESTHGQLREHEPPPKFKLKAIVPLENAAGEPTRAADPLLTPELPGVTDQSSISDWHLPFELVEKIRPQDEDYWDKYRTTPKAFVSLATAKRLWTSRWGTISLLRIPVNEPLRDSQSQLEQMRLQVEGQLLQNLDPASIGMMLLPVKAQGLAAASGTTPFDGLFLGFSCFLIAAAVMLIALLFQLGIQQRGAEIGTLAAVGVGRRRIAALLSREGLVVTMIGAAVGIIGGVLYAWLMIYGLRTWWLAAISTPFLRLHVRPTSLLVGWIVGLVVSWLTIRWSIRKLARLPAARLLAGSTSGELEPDAPVKARRNTLVWPKLHIAIAILTLALCIAGFVLHGEAQAGSFFGSGAAMLALMLGEIRYRLLNFGRHIRARHDFSLLQLSVLNTTRNPGRSTLTIGLVAAASFLIIAVSAFRLDTGEGGTGGFDLVATSDLPIHFDLNTPEGRRELGFSDEADRQLEKWQIFSLRVAAGEDASCLNLYQATQPRVLGFPVALVERGGFEWAATADGFSDRPWTSLNAELKRDEAGQPIVPVALDMATAIYSLHLRGVGSRLTIRDAADRPVTLEVVGLLKNSVLQGNLLVSEANFLRMFPNAAGYRFFLLEEVGVASRATPVRLGSADLLESTFAEEGFDAVDARDKLAQFLAVQNTYLSTFQSLGALGLLLGTIGLAVVQLRSVLERRGELALMRAGGFPRGRLTWMVVWENAVLLLGGLVVGTLSAAVALLPQWVPQGAGVPWSALGLLLGAIVLVGLAAGWLATRSALRAPIVGALRGD